MDRPPPNPLKVPPQLAEAPLDRIVRELCGAESWGRARKWIRGGKVFVDEQRSVDPSQRVAQGSTISLRMSAPRHSVRKAQNVRMLHVDAQVVVVLKPAGISTVPFEGAGDALDGMVKDALFRREQRRSAPPGVVQRLDRETSGLLVFARTTAAKKHLQQQFRQHSVGRHYLALALGSPAGGRIESRLVKDRGDGKRGSTRHAELGRSAVTHVRVLERFASCSLILCRLETGRTHQIRIHLGEAGHPLLGERVYGSAEARERAAGPGRLMLHAASLAFDHPRHGARLSFIEPPPADFLAALTAAGGDPGTLSLTRLQSLFSSHRDT